MSAVEEDSGDTRVACISGLEDPAACDAYEWAQVEFIGQVMRDGRQTERYHGCE